jgi:hypothetical protein
MRIINNNSNSNRGIPTNPSRKNRPPFKKNVDDVKFIYRHQPSTYNNDDKNIDNTRLTRSEMLDNPTIMSLIEHKNQSQSRNLQNVTKKNSSYNFNIKPEDVDYDSLDTTDDFESDSDDNIFGTPAKVPIPIYRNHLVLPRTTNSDSQIRTSKSDLQNDFKHELPQEVLLSHFSEHKCLAKIILMKETCELLFDELQTEITSLIKLINSIFSEISQSGGDVGTCRQHQTSLEYQKTDTLHDFAKGRNGVFPYPFSSQAFYDEIIGTIFNDYILPDKFHTYYDSGKNLGTLEDRIKNDYLNSVNHFGDESCEPPFNKCSFYFTQKDAVLNKALHRYVEHSKLHDQDFTKEFKQYVTQGYGYYVIDACMSVQGDEVFNQMTRLDSLCTLFDPVGTTTFDTQRIDNNIPQNGIFIDDKDKYNLRLEKENKIDTTTSTSTSTIPIDGDIYDCKFINGKKTEREGKYSIETDSFYDLAYNHLLNVHTLEKYGIIFKLRLCYFDRTVNKKNIKGYKVCICVYTEPPRTDALSAMPINRATATPIAPLTLKYVCAPLQSFSLHELAVGMAYVHDLENNPGLIDSTENYKAPNGDDLSPDLKELIHKLKTLIAESSTYSLEFNPKKLYHDLKLILMRLKAAGDHGSAESSRLIHLYCGSAKSQTMYLSGDQLCFVYSMMIGNATLFRYYAGSGKKQTGTCDINEDCHECLTTVPDPSKKKQHIHFLGFYNPGINYTTLINNIIDRCKAYIGQEFQLDQPDQPDQPGPRMNIGDIEKRIRHFMNIQDLANFETEKTVFIREIYYTLTEVRKNTNDTNAEQYYHIVGNIESMLHKLKFIEKRLGLKDFFQKIIDKNKNELDIRTNFSKYTAKRGNPNIGKPIEVFAEAEHSADIAASIDSDITGDNKANPTHSIIAKIRAYKKSVSKKIKTYIDEIKKSFGTEVVPIAMASLEHDINEQTLSEINKLIDEKIVDGEKENAKTFFKSYLLPIADVVMIPIVEANAEQPARKKQKPSQGGKRKSKKARKGNTRKYKYKKRTTRKRHHKITKRRH